ncbi:MAG: hypothetical protein P4M14_10455 [Gammaproteobacteria bacterium]|nr:hypothetical protein [Gammaproteobacteria bacterium]
MPSHTNPIDPSFSFVEQSDVVKPYHNDAAAIVAPSHDVVEAKEVDDEGQPLVIQNPVNGVIVKKKKNYYWQKSIQAFNLLAELSNVGIFYKVVASWLPFIQALGPVLGTIAGIADPMIYFFRSLIRVTRVVGREYFDITFDEEEKGRHKWQTRADLASLALFSLAIPLFFGLIIASPVGITVAWALAISGLGVSAYFDYAYPAKCAKNHYLDTLANGGSQQEIDDAYDEYQTKKTSKRFFFALVFSISLLVLCTSAAVFAPPAIVPILFLLSKTASACLALIAVGRFRNAHLKKIDLKAIGIKNKDKPENDLQKDATETDELKQDATLGISATSSAKVTLAIAAAAAPSTPDDSQVPGAPSAILMPKSPSVIVPTKTNLSFTTTVKTPKGRRSPNHFFQEPISSQVTPWLGDAESLSQSALAQHTPKPVRKFTA